MHLIPHLGAQLTKEHLTFLKIFSTSCRKSIILMLKKAQSGHPGGSLSSIDFLSLLYAFIISQTGEKVIISNGHISPAVYSVLAELGYVSKQELIQTFRQVNSHFEGHVTRHVPGVCYGTGPLGIGAAVASGFALANELKKSKEKVFCLMGDGEAQEGEIYEMMHFANKYQLKNLIMFVDYNQIQLSGRLEEIMPIDIPALFKSAHWNVIDVDGHDYQKLWTALHEAYQQTHAPTVLIGRTLMGKGVDFMEEDSKNNTVNWHGVAPSPEQADRALLQLIITKEEELLLDSFRKNIVQFKPQKPFSLEKHSSLINTGNPHIFSADKKTDCRSAYGDALKDLADLNPQIVALTADLGGSVKTDIMKKIYPERVFDVGIAEQHMVSCAGGLSLGGFVPFCSTFGAFMTSRAKDQARVNDINRTNVKMIATHCGLSVGEDGPTHQAIDDMGSFLGFFHTAILEPSDPNLCDHMVRYVAKTYGNFYIRMGRAKVPILTKENRTPYYDEQYRFELGKADLIRIGANITVLAAGPMVAMALSVREKFSFKNQIEIICLNSLSHLDEMLLLKSFQKTKKVLIIEDHNPYNGYTSVVSSFIARKGLQVTFDFLAITEYQLSGKAEELYDEAGIGMKTIQERIEKMLR